jgi:hypothetical protein
VSYEVYRLVHLAGIFLTILSLGGLTMRAFSAAPGTAGRPLALASHGLGLLLALVGGFGMLAKAKLGMGAWVGLKVVIWLALGAAIVVPKRWPRAAGALWALVPLLALLAAWTAQTKPGA